jgi:hypothetical protein
MKALAADSELDEDSETMQRQWLQLQQIEE